MNEEIKEVKYAYEILGISEDEAYAQEQNSDEERGN